MSDPKTADDIEALIADFQRSGMRELHVRADGLEIYLSNDADAQGIDVKAAPPSGQASAAPATPGPPAPASAPASTAPTAPSATAPAAADLPPGAVIVRAPYLGTFYRAPKPGSPVYVDIGSRVTAESELCLVEVMKLFTAVRADLAGTVHAILATDGQMVEADQPLFVILPA